MDQNRQNDLGYSEDNMLATVSSIASAQNPQNMNTYKQTGQLATSNVDQPVLENFPVYQDPQDYVPDNQNEEINKK